eukprot:NODE_1031_length_2532_cov_0.285656.p1 type:complete len:237 gc:universal NODE_1031_length_2532_cov_0.285656:1473-763(-)
MQLAFDTIKKEISRNLQLVQPKFGQPFDLYVDASGEAAGFVLMQNHQPIGYESRKFTSLERKYKSYELEAYAILLRLEHFKYYLIGALVIVYSDMISLKWLFHNPQFGRLGRWCLRMAVFDFEIVYVKGTKNPSDVLSRNLPPFMLKIGGNAGGEVSSKEMLNKVDHLPFKRIPKHQEHSNTVLLALDELLLECRFLEKQNSKYLINKSQFESISRLYTFKNARESGNTITISSGN